MGAHCIIYELGVLAQLGERYAGSVEVRGSSPLSSTKWTIREHLFFQRRFCRKSVAVMSEQSRRAKTHRALALRLLRVRSKSDEKIRSANLLIADDRRRMIVHTILASMASTSSVIN